MCSLASQTCRRTGLLNCCHGIGTIRTCRWSLELGIMLYAIRGPRRVLSLDWQQDIDDWRSGAPGHPSRSDAIRILLAKGLFAAYAGIPSRGVVRVGSRCEPVNQFEDRGDPARSFAGTSAALQCVLLGFL